MDRRLLIFGGVVGIAVLGAGVIIAMRPHQPPADLAVPPGATSAEYEVTPDLQVNVYVDGSGSIEHFLHDPYKNAQSKNAQSGGEYRTGGTNFLENVLENIESTSETSMWKGLWDQDPEKSKLKFWRFGGDCPVLLKQTGDERVNQMGANPAGKFREKATEIDIPYMDDPTAKCPGRTSAKQGSDSLEGDERRPAPELKILISDLYVSDPRRKSLHELAPILADKYLSDDSSAVSILAIRNPYFGQVEDFPGGQKPEAASMPFYVVLAGPVADVQYGTRLFVDHLGLLEAFQKDRARLIYFSRGASGGAGAPSVEGNMLHLHEFTPKYNSSDIPFYTLSEGTATFKWPSAAADTWASATPDWKPEWSIATGTFSSQQPGAEVYGTKKGARNPPKPDLAAALAITTCPNLTEQACIVVDRGKLRRGNDYLFSVNVLASRAGNFRNGDEDAQAIKSWSFHPNPNEQNPRDAERTLDLSEFLYTLQNAIFPNDAPRAVSKHYIYMQAN